NYTVKRGDSLYAIAASYGTTTQKLKQTNGLGADRIYAGQKLLVPTATSGLTQDEIWLMAKMIYAEARGESDKGQLAVGAVIMNRIKSDLFPNTMNGVLYQRTSLPPYRMVNSTISIPTNAQSMRLKKPPWDKTPPAAPCSTGTLKKPITHG
ncbi:MAG: LysM peptidoglycan-binding domain-containing protein, partial [Firmicutes bacterium]|nr:LysM peptidoglycan-binding domain-containing protein [Bacillota bacterium]